jgi:hypothetical protein
MSLGFSPWLSWASQLSTGTYGHWLEHPRGALPRWPRSWLRPPLLHLQWSLAPWTSKWLHPLSLTPSATPLISPLISHLIPLNLWIRVLMYWSKYLVHRCLDGLGCSG